METLLSSIRVLINHLVKNRELLHFLHEYGLLNMPELICIGN